MALFLLVGPGKDDSTGRRRRRKGRKVERRVGRE
jgi:hypothetical protein